MLCRLLWSLYFFLSVLSVSVLFQPIASWLCTCNNDYLQVCMYVRTYVCTYVYCVRFPNKAYVEQAFVVRVSDVCHCHPWVMNTSTSFSYTVGVPPHKSWNSLLTHPLRDNKGYYWRVYVFPEISEKFRVKNASPERCEQQISKPGQTIYQIVHLLQIFPCKSSGFFFSAILFREKSGKKSVEGVMLKALLSSNCVMKG